MKTHAATVIASVSTTLFVAISMALSMTSSTANASTLGEAMVEAVQTQHQKEVASGTFHAVQAERRTVLAASHLNNDSHFNQLKGSQAPGAPGYQAAANEATSVVSSPIAMAGPLAAAGSKAPVARATSAAAEISRGAAETHRHVIAKPPTPKAPLSQATHH